MPQPFPICRVEVRLDFGPDPRMIGVEPVSLLPREKIAVDQVAINRRKRERVEAHHRDRAARNRFGWRHHAKVLDANAVLAFSVEARLDGEDHARLQRGHTVARNGLRPLVDREKTADPVPRAVSIIQTRTPQRIACNGIEIHPARSLREAGCCESDMCLQHQRKVTAHGGRRRANGDGSRDVRRTLNILATRIDEVERAGAQQPVCASRDTVVDDRAVLACA